MKIQHICLVFIVIIAPVISMAAFEDYPVSSLAQIITSNSPGSEIPALQKPGDLYFDMAMHAARTKVVCTGQTRSLLPERYAFLEHLFKARQQLQFLELFKYEVSCREGNVSYWLPIQSQILEIFHKEVAADTTVDLYVMFLGMYRSENNTLEIIFAINGFHAIATPDAVEQ